MWQGITVKNCIAIDFKAIEKIAGRKLAQRQVNRIHRQGRMFILELLINVARGDMSMSGQNQSGHGQTLWGQAQAVAAQQGRDFMVG